MNAGYRLLVLVLQLLSLLAVVLIIGGDNLAGLLVDERPVFVPSDPLQTPLHVAPQWYYAPFHVLERITPKLLPAMTLVILSLVCVGVFFLLVMFAAVRIMNNKNRDGFLPGQRSFVAAISVVVICVIALGVIGSTSYSGYSVWVRILAGCEFMVMAVMPLYALPLKKS